MKVLTTDKFISKVKKASPEQTALINRFASMLAEATVQDLKSIQGRAIAKQRGVYVHRLGQLRLFYSVDEEQSTIFLLDLLQETGRFEMDLRGAGRNPQYNHNINPNYNHNINPNYNHSINPNYNHNINPNYNHSINPNYNHSINPNYNHSINPNYNHSINPNYNHSINPNYNHSINPMYNPHFSGLIVYDASINKGGYFIKVIPEVAHEYDLAMQELSFHVIAASELTTCFRALDTEWVGYCLHIPEIGYIRFDRDGTWIGIIV